ncbi:MAG TPA: 4-(cytidine 5'-diphospho)-2-C-methyl-D-erythritol kinase [Gemmatimonadaceae bacterium]|nr:4-(cytidine 5'-diphospho)-2-C-methyl-D-erythritol kinase [Gemmatimonadaceae bacterium]
MSGPAARIQAQAKLNLYLRVLNREASGYHSIETIYHRLDLADEIAVYAEDDRLRAIDVQGIDIGPAEQNLAYRAAVAYQEEANWPRGFTIELDKKIPVGSGLGGGSADAGAVLRILDSLARKPLGQKKLLAIAASMGTDVPFLVSREPMALAWGRGERMLGLNALPQRDVLLVIPEFSVATPEAYQWIDEDRPTDPDPTTYSASDLLLITEDMLASWQSIARVNKNDFIGPVADRHPVIREYLAMFKDLGSFLCSMSGSGSAVFGVYDALPDSTALGGFSKAILIPTRTADKVVQPIRIG